MTREPPPIDWSLCREALSLTSDDPPTTTTTCRRATVDGHEGVLIQVTGHVDPPDGYDETLAVVKALRAFADEAKRRHPERAERIEQEAIDAMGALWRVYRLDEPRGGQ